MRMCLQAGDVRMLSDKAKQAWQRSLETLKAHFCWTGLLVCFRLWHAYVNMYTWISIYICTYMGVFKNWGSSLGVLIMRITIYGGLFWGPPFLEAPNYIFIIYTHAQPRQGYDNTRDPVIEDLGTSVGFLRATYLVLRIKPAGLAFFGLPCNSFSFMSSSLHGRSEEQPWGCICRGFVVQGNMLGARCALLIALAISRLVTWALENPGRSSVPTFPYLKNLMHIEEFWSGMVFWRGVVEKCSIL